MRRVSSRERASALMLMPAAVMVMIVLGSIAVDFAAVGLRARELHNAAAAAANDAAVAGLSPEGLRRGDTVIDPERARAVVRAGLSARGIELDAPPVVDVDPDGRSVTVYLTLTQRYVFASAIPGARHNVHLQARATAVALTADGS